MPFAINQDNKAYTPTDIVNTKRDNNISSNNIYSIKLNRMNNIPNNLLFSRSITETKLPTRLNSPKRMFSTTPALSIKNPFSPYPLSPLSPLNPMYKPNTDPAAKVDINFKFKSINERLSDAEEALDAVLETIEENDSNGDDNSEEYILKNILEKKVNFYHEIYSAIPPKYAESESPRIISNILHRLSEKTAIPNSPFFGYRSLFKSENKYEVRGYTHPGTTTEHNLDVKVLKMIRSESVEPSINLDKDCVNYMEKKQMIFNALNFKTEEPPKFYEKKREVPKFNDENLNMYEAKSMMEDTDENNLLWYLFKSGNFITDIIEVFF